MSLTVPEAARRIGRNPETIRRWIRAGKLRAHKVGTQHVIEELDLEELLEDPWDRELPYEWSHDDDGNKMPNWERIQRNQRDYGH